MINVTEIVVIYVVPGTLLHKLICPHHGQICHRNATEMPQKYSPNRVDIWSTVLRVACDGVVSNTGGKIHCRHAQLQSLDMTSSWSPRIYGCLPPSSMIYRSLCRPPILLFVLLLLSALIRIVFSNWKGLEIGQNHNPFVFVDQHLCQSGFADSIFASRHFKKNCPSQNLIALP